MSTNEYIKGVKKKIFLPFEKTLWQRNYYDRVIRNEKELETIRGYIFYNPIRKVWDEEEFERFIFQ